MEETQINQQEIVDQIHNYTAHLLMNENKTTYEAKMALMEKGLNETDAEALVENMQNHINEAKKSRANKDILYGALWCAGGTILTLADVGFIFWGAIVFGGIQLVKGLINRV